MYKKVHAKIIIITVAMVAAAILTVPSYKGQLSHAQPNQDMQGVLDLHSRERAAVDAPPLTWSNSLAVESQGWANYLATLGLKCTEQNGKTQCDVPPHDRTGTSKISKAESISYLVLHGVILPGESVSKTSLAELAQAWANEKMKLGQRGAVVGHYLAMVNKNFREVGCGYSSEFSYENEFLVCRYS
jgi:uncharacterized protein YkwD